MNIEKDGPFSSMLWELRWRIFWLVTTVTGMTWLMTGEVHYGN